MKGISKTAYAGLSPLIPAVLAPPEVLTQAPPGFIPPPLNPSGARLETRELAPGVYGLLSSKPPVDNSGFVVGERGVLVIDAHINGAMAGLIQSALRQVTNKPILYVVNTNYHGDHTFGNYAFPQETLIVAQQKTAEIMRDFEREKQFLLPTVDNDPTVFGDVRLRLPDLVLDEYLELDLGGRVVELYHFGHGNTPGDTVVFVPEARAAWTGNLITGEGTIPFLIEGGAGAYLETMAKFTHTLEVGTIVPGHGLLTSGAILGRYLPYLSELIESVRKAIRAGQNLEEAIAATPLGRPQRDLEHGLRRRPTRRRATVPRADDDRLFTRECLAISVGHGLSGRDVVARLERLRFERGLAQRIYCDNGSEFVSAAMDLWAYTNGVILDFSRRGKPTDNGAIESKNV